MMETFFVLVSFAIGYWAAIYSWEPIKAFIAKVKALV